METLSYPVDTARGIGNNLQLGKGLNPLTDTFLSPLVDIYGGVKKYVVKIDDHAGLNYTWLYSSTNVVKQNNLSINIFGEAKSMLGNGGKSSFVFSASNNLFQQSLTIILYVRLVDHIERFNLKAIGDELIIDQNFVKFYGTHYLSEKIVGKELQILFNFKNVTQEVYNAIKSSIEVSYDGGFGSFQFNSDISTIISERSNNHKLDIRVNSLTKAGITVEKTLQDAISTTIKSNFTDADLKKTISDNIKLLEGTSVALCYEASVYPPDFTKKDIPLDIANDERIEAAKKVISYYVFTKQRLKLLDNLLVKDIKLDNAVEFESNVKVQIDIDNHYIAILKDFYDKLISKDFNSKQDKIDEPPKNKFIQYIDTIFPMEVVKLNTKSYDKSQPYKLEYRISKIPVYMIKFELVNNIFFEATEITDGYNDHDVVFTFDYFELALVNKGIRPLIEKDVSNYFMNDLPLKIQIVDIFGRDYKRIDIAFLSWKYDKAKDSLGNWKNDSVWNKFN